MTTANLVPGVSAARSLRERSRDKPIRPVSPKRR